MTETIRNFSTTVYGHPTVDFAVRWLPYGGGSAADIFVQFGVSERVFFERLASTIERTTDMHELLRADLTRLCSQRLDR